MLAQNGINNLLLRAFQIIVLLNLSLIFFYYIYMSLLAGKSGPFHLDSSTNKQKKVNEPSPRNPEWEQVNKFAFFRRSGAFYFVDTQLLRMFYMTTHSERKKDYDLVLSVFDKRMNNRLIKEIKLSRKNAAYAWEHKDPYVLQSLDIHQFDLAKELNATSLDELVNDLDVKGWTKNNFS